MRLFAAISVDETLPKRKKRGIYVEEEEEEIELGLEIIDATNPGATIATVSAQTYQNYKSAISIPS